MLFVEPNPPLPVTVTEYTTTTATFNWVPPDEKDYSYELEVTPSDKTEAVVKKKDLFGVTSAKVESLIPGTAYKVNVVAILNTVTSDPATADFSMSM